MTASYTTSRDTTAAAPDYANGPDCTGIISQRHLKRIRELLQEARDRQSRVVTLGGDPGPDSGQRRLPLYLVVDPAPELCIMHEEIFGPILPVVPYDGLGEAVAHVNGGDRPLGLYLFREDPVVTARIVDSTSSEGVCINACAMQSALPSLGFGGTGVSGMGRHHGIEGFREFSNPRGVFVRGDGDMISAFYPPYQQAAALVQAVLTA